MNKLTLETTGNTTDGLKLNLNDDHFGLFFTEMVITMKVNSLIQIDADIMFLAVDGKFTQHFRFHGQEGLELINQIRKQFDIIKLMPMDEAHKLLNEIYGGHGTAVLG